MKTTLKILFLFLPFISHSQANLGTGFFGKVGINVGSTTPTERLKVNGTSAFVGLGTFSGGLTATGTVSLPSTTSIGSVSSTEISYINGLLSPAQTQLDTLLAIANRKSRILITNVEIVSPNPADYAAYDYVFDTAAGKIYKYEYRSPPELPSFSEIGDFTTKEEVASNYAGLITNNNFTGSNLFLTPIFANSTSTSAYSSVTGAWSNTGNLGVFSLRYNTKFGGSTVTWNPIRLDANGWVGIGMNPSQAFEVLGAAKFNSAITATSISASGATSALSFSSTNNMTSPKFTINGTGYIANGSDVSMGAGSTADIVTYNTSGRIMFSTAGSVRATITNAGNFGIGTLAPTSRFEVSGTSSMRYNDGGQADGKYLRSNSTGIASWAFVALSEVTGLGTGVATFLATPSSANLLAAMTTKTGTGSLVFNTNPSFSGDIAKNDSNGYMIYANRAADGGNYGLYYDSGFGDMRIYTNSSSRLSVNLNGNVAIGGLTANTNAIVDIQSTTKAFKLPVMTATQASAITPSAGFMVYVTDTNGTFTSVGFWGYTTSWQKLNN